MQLPVTNNFMFGLVRHNKAWILLSPDRISTMSSDYIGVNHSITSFNEFDECFLTLPCSLSPPLSVSWRKGPKTLTFLLSSFLYKERERSLQLSFPLSFSLTNGGSSSNSVKLRP